MGEQVQEDSLATVHCLRTHLIHYHDCIPLPPLPRWYLFIGLAHHISADTTISCGFFSFDTHSTLAYIYQIRNQVCIGFDSSINAT